MAHYAPERDSSETPAPPPGIPVEIIRRSRLRLIPISELSKWLDSNAARALEAGS